MNTEKLTRLVAAVICTAFAILHLGAVALDRSAASEVTFEKDVYPILQMKCQTCHHPGGSAPMSLVGYAETRPWARDIKEKVTERIMPPFYAAGPIGYYQDDGRLTEEEIKIISKWVDDGAPRGRASNEPRESRWSADSSTEKPNLQLKINTPYKVKKDGPDDYEYFAFDYVFPQDTWIRGVDVLPSNTSAVHHVVVYILPERINVGADGRIEGANPLMGATVMFFWNSGSHPLKLPPKSALVIPKGSRLGLEVHYAPTTLDGVVDQPSVGIYYANGVVDKLVHSQYGITRNIEIPAGQKSYQLVVYKKFATDALIVSFGANMHLRGKSFTIRMIYPDGKRETVFELPRFHFYWQRSYILAKPLAVPRGTVAEYIAEWDNSAGNPYNPDPSRSVRFGLGTNDEMMGGRITYLIPEEELRSNIKDGIKTVPPAVQPEKKPSGAVR